MQLWYLAHPYEGDPKNLERARNWVRSIEAAVEDVAVVAQWIVECQVWNDSDPAERDASMMRNFAVLAKCDAIVLVGGRVSKGMESERDEALRLGITVLDWTPLGKMPIENLADVLQAAADRQVPTADGCTRINFWLHRPDDNKEER